MCRVWSLLACICIFSSFCFASALTLVLNSTSDLYEALDTGSLNSMSEPLTVEFSSSTFLLTRSIDIRASSVILLGSGTQFTCNSSSFIAMRFEADSVSILNVNISSCLGAISLQCNALPCFLSISSSSFTSNQGGRGVVVMDQAGPASAVNISDTAWSLNSNSSSLFVDGSNGSVNAVLSRCTFDRQYGGSGQGQGSLSTVDMTGVLSASVVGCIFQGCATGDAVGGLSLVSSSSQPSHVSIVDTTFLSQSASLGQEPTVSVTRPLPPSCWILPWASSVYLGSFSRVSIDSMTLQNNSGLANIRIVNCVNVSISRSRMVGNSVSSGGGAIFLANSSTTKIGPNCLFDSNRANATSGYGGAIHGIDVSMEVFSSVFSGNVARASGGALALTASGSERAPLYFTASNVTVRNNTAFVQLIDVNNITGYGGGGLILALEFYPNIFVPNSRPYWRRDRVVISNSTFLDNFVPGGSVGGGLAIFNTGFTLNHCVFINNSASLGGAVAAGYNSTNTPQPIAILYNSSFTHNSAIVSQVVQRRSYGGAVIFNGMFSVSVSQLRILNNSGDGGAITCYGASFNATDCYFIGNSGQIGAALVTLAFTASPDSSSSFFVPVISQLTRCVFEDNVANGLGGGAVSAQSVKQLLISSCSFYRNGASVGPGGAVYITNSPTNISNSTFTLNTANGAGGGIFSSDSTIYVIGSSFTQNVASNQGAGICSISVNPNANDLLSISGSSSFTGNSLSQATGSGGAMYVSILRADVSNTSFVGNVAQQGPGLAALGTSLNVDSTSTTLICYQPSSATDKKLTYCNDTPVIPSPSPPPLPLLPSISESRGDKLGLVLGLSIGLGLATMAVILTLIFLRLKKRQGMSNSMAKLAEATFDNPSIPPHPTQPRWDPVKELEQLTSSLKVERLARAATPAPQSNEASDPDHQTSSVSLQLGTSLPDTLEILEMIGQGGQGSVYRGRWKGAEVAIKTFVFSHSEVSNKRSPRDQAILEAGVSSSMDHENVVASLHIEICPMALSYAPESAVHIVESETMWKAYLVQELMDCNLCSLVEKKMFDKGGLDLKKLATFNILKDVSSGMAYIHNLNIIHGDLKPDNILIRRDRRKQLGMIAKITDFGLCSRINGNKTHVSNFFGGTRFYTDPNIRASGQTSKSSDAYSFGLLMIELFTGRQPYLRALDGSFVENRDFLDPLTMPREYLALVLRCLNPEAKSRPTFRQIVATLSQNIDSLQQI